MKLKSLISESSHNCNCECGGLNKKNGKGKEDIIDETESLSEGNFNTDAIRMDLINAFPSGIKSKVIKFLALAKRYGFEKSSDYPKTSYLNKTGITTLAALHHDRYGWETSSDIFLYIANNNPSKLQVAAVDWREYNDINNSYPKDIESWLRPQMWELLSFEPEIDTSIRNSKLSGEY